MLAAPVTARQSKAFRIPFHIEAGKDVLVELKAQTHKYEKDELRALLDLMDESLGCDKSCCDAMLDSPALSDFLAAPQNGTGIQNGGEQ